MQTSDDGRVLAKANFDDIYDRSDPRAYYRRLGAFDYAVPHYGQQMFRQVVDALPAERPTLVDLCCSYGVNAALMKHDLGLHDLYERYRSPEVAELSREELAALDREFYAGVLHDDAPEVIGLDTAAPAVDYALDVGLLDGGVAQNLEIEEPSPDLAAKLRTADALTVTGGIGYVTERTFDRLLGCTDPDDRPWVASLCLRTVDFEPIAECLADHGLVTEHLDGVTFPQRRFTGDDERDYALTELDQLGLDPSGREAEGAYHVSVYLSRPAEDAATLPIGRVLQEIPLTTDHVPSA